MGALTVVVGGQLGSEGKGAVAAALARRKNRRVHVCVRVAGPNAGHTAVDDTGRAWALRQVPAVAVVDRNCELVIAAGSEIDPEVLKREIDELDAAGFGVSERLWIDAQATVIELEHKLAEAGGNTLVQGEDLTGRVGSTAKGIGAARAERIWRRASTVGDVGFGPADHVIDTQSKLALDLVDGKHVLIEGTQGYGLGLHAGYYPYCTSSDCRAIDFMAMCGISPWQLGAGLVEVWVVCRTYPIRVAGNSGPLHGELDWQQMSQLVGREVLERTTVTQKVRRVGKWDPALVQRAMLANGGGHGSGDRHGFRVRMALTFADYWFPKLYGKTITELADIDPVAAKMANEDLRQVERETRSEIGYVGTGADTGWWR